MEVARLTPEQALKLDGFYFVTSTVMPSAEIVGAHPSDGAKATLVCLMLVTDGRMFICNPTQELPLDKMAKGLIFQGPLNPGVSS